MIITIRHKITKKTGKVTTSHNNPDQAVNPVYPKIFPLLPDLIGESYGIYGHIVNPNNTSNADLIAAIAELEDYEIIDQDPKEIAFPDLPKSPKGVPGIVT